MILFDQAGAGARTATMFAAPPSLRPFVEHFWTQRDVSPSIDQPWRIPPDANPYLIFTVLESASRELRTRCMLVGPCSSFLDIPVRGRVFTCGVRLRPGVLPLLTRLPAFELTNGALPVEEAFGSRGRVLLEQLSEPTFWDQAPQRMAEFLRRELTERGSFRPLSVHGIDRVHELAEIVGLSDRTLHHRVAQQIGFSPKLWLRIERLHRAIGCSLNRVRPWSDIAKHCGFADQAHMVREFTALLGESPTTWSKRSPFLPPTGTADYG
ncbi:MAG: helix-turn-helix domain-containing protein [Bryobacteraceae bacterium]